MIIEPKIRGFICTTAHPEGCAQNVKQQIEFIQSQKPIEKTINNVLIIGCSTGYGLASRITAAFGCHAATLGVMFEKPATDKRTASAGWYNTAAFEDYAQQQNLYAKTINGDAFSNEVKQQVINTIKNDWPNGVDLIIYSLASPKRTDPSDGITYNSTLKTIGKPLKEKTVDMMTGEVSQIEIEPANEQEMASTVKVMGGEDWQLWIEALLTAEALAENAQTIAYSYIGPEITYPIYRHGTIGKAKEHLEATVKAIEKTLAKINGRALISVNKCLITQASSAIPIVPLYTAILYKVMRDKNLHEGCIEQIYRLFSDYLISNQAISLDKNGFIRIDDWEMRDDVQTEVQQIWQQIDSDNIKDIADLQICRDEFYRLFGFGLQNVNYQVDVDTEKTIKSIN